MASTIALSARQLKKLEDILSTIELTPGDEELMLPVLKRCRQLIGNGYADVKQNKVLDDWLEKEPR